MPSQALRKWRTTQRAELDRLDAAVRAVDASQPALRQQLVDMYILLLAGQFQGYCRALHDEAAGIVVGHIRPAGAGVLVSDLLTGRRQLAGAGATGPARPAAAAPAGAAEHLAERHRTPGPSARPGKRRESGRHRPHAPLGAPLARQLLSPGAPDGHDCKSSLDNSVRDPTVVIA